MKTNGRRILVVLVIAALAAMSVDTIASAAWQVNSANTTATAKATSMPAGKTPTPAIVGASVELVWPALMLAGAPVDGYVVHAYDATTNASRAVNSSCDGTVTTTGCTETNAPVGSWRYTVTPTSGGWHGAESPKSIAVTVAPAAPSVAITFPSLSAYNDAGWDGGCSSSICGTASAPAGLQSIRVSVRQTNGRYWDGFGFNSWNEKFFTPTGTTTWSLSFPDDFLRDDSYTVKAVVTDDLDATATDTASFTIDNTAPTGDVLISSAMRNGDELALYNVNERGSGLASVEYRYCSGPWWCTPTNVIGAVPQPVVPSYTLPWTGMPADGTYYVAALLTDNAGNSRMTANQAVVVDNTPPTVTSLFVSNGGTKGTADTDDTIVIGFSDDLLTSTLCSNWFGTGDQSITGNNQVTVTINDNAGATGNDTLTVTAKTCTFHLGTIDLGSNAWVTRTTDFKGSRGEASTISYSDGTLTIVLGDGSGASHTVSSQTMTYTPDGVIADAAGNTIDTTPFSKANLRF